MKRLVVAIFVVSSLSLADQETELLNCHFKESNGEELAEGYVRVVTGTPLKGSVEFLTPERDLKTAQNVVQQDYNKEQALELTQDDHIGQFVFENGKVKRNQVVSAITYDLDPSDDGSLAAVIVYKDKKGKHLAAGGAVGWYPIMCR